MDERTGKFLSEREQKPILGNMDPRLMRQPGLNSEPMSSQDGPVIYISPEIIDPNPDQPRKIFDDKNIAELSESLRQDGLLQPLVVVENDQTLGRYLLVAGERRLRASKLAGLTTIPVMVRTIPRQDHLRIALIENIQRSDLNAIEEAHAYAALMKDCGLTQEECANKVGKERTTIANSLRLLTLPVIIQEDLVAGRMSRGHAKALLSLEKDAEMLRAREVILKKDLSVRKTERLCQNTKKNVLDQKGNTGDSLKDHLDPDIEYIAESLRSYLRTKVKISGVSQRGKIEISYFSVAELERVLSLISKNLQS